MLQGVRGGHFLRLVALTAPVVSCSPTAPDALAEGAPGGTYELTIESNCTALPPAMRKRTWLVSIRDGVATVSGTFFRHPTQGLANKITIAVSGSAVSLAMNFTYGFDRVGLFEEPTPGQYFGILGFGSGTVTPGKRPVMTGKLDAAFAYGEDLIRPGRHVECARNPNSGSFRFEPLPFAAPPAVAGSPIVTKVDISGPASLAPGEQFQYAAIATMSNGSQQDVTGSAFWTITGSTSTYLHLGMGLVLGKEVGEDKLFAVASIPNITSTITGSRAIIVTPPGTVRVNGVVTANSGPVSGAKVTVSTGPSAGLSTTTDWDGRYAIFGIAGPGDLVITKVGYASATLGVSGTEHQTVNAGLVPVGALLNVAGTYTLTMEASPSCRANLTDAARRRTYTATIVQNSTRAFVTLSGGQFAFNKFEGRVDPGEVQFTLIDYWDYYWTGGPAPDVAETLSNVPFRQVVISGRTNTQPAPNGFAGLLEGEFLVFDRPIVGNTSPWMAPWFIESCGASDHSFTLTRAGAPGP